MRGCARACACLFVCLWVHAASQRRLLHEHLSGCGCGCGCGSQSLPTPSGQHERNAPRLAPVHSDNMCMHARRSTHLRRYPSPHATPAQVVERTPSPMCMRRQVTVSARRCGLNGMPRPVCSVAAPEGVVPEGVVPGVRCGRPHTYACTRTRTHLPASGGSSARFPPLHGSILGDAWEIASFAARSAAASCQPHAWDRYEHERKDCEGSSEGRSGRVLCWGIR
jgi:hypothetical protein